MGERAGGSRGPDAGKPAKSSKPKATSKVPINDPAELAVFLMELKSHGAAYTVEANDDGGWLVEITGV